MLRRLLRTTPFPYTTLFRSLGPKPPDVTCPIASAAKWSRNKDAPERTGARPSGDKPTRLRGAPSRNCARMRSEEHTSELQSQSNLVCRLLLEKKKLLVWLIL